MHICSVTQQLINLVPPDLV